MAHINTAAHVMLPDGLTAAEYPGLQEALAHYVDSVLDCFDWSCPFDLDEVTMDGYRALREEDPEWAHLPPLSDETDDEMEIQIVYEDQ